MGVICLRVAVVGKGGKCLTERSADLSALADDRDPEFDLDDMTLDFRSFCTH